MDETVNMMTVHLHGSLKKEFGEKFTLAVHDAAEAIRALCAMLPNFRLRVQNGHFRVKVDDTYATMEDVQAKLQTAGSKDLHLTPVVSGKGSGKGGQIAAVVVGIILIIIAIWFPPAGAAGAGAAGGAGAAAGGAGAAAGGGWGTALGMSAATAAKLTNVMLAVGLSMTMSGVSGLLAKTPNTDLKGKEQNSSTGFSNLGNVAAQGAIIPLIYGEILVGSVVVSARLATYGIKEGSTDLGKGYKESTTPKWLKDHDDLVADAYKMKNWKKDGMPEVVIAKGLMKKAARGLRKIF